MAYHSTNTPQLSSSWSSVPAAVLCLERSSSPAAAKSLQSCPTLCDPIDGSPPASPIPGILQARTLEWVAISFSKNVLLPDPNPPTNRGHSTCSLCFLLKILKSYFSLTVRAGVGIGINLIGRVCMLTVKIKESLGWLTRGNTDFVLLQKILWLCEAFLICVTKRIMKRAPHQTQALLSIKRTKMTSWEAQTSLVLSNVCYALIFPESWVLFPWHFCCGFLFGSIFPGRKCYQPVLSCYLHPRFVLANITCLGASEMLLCTALMPNWKRHYSL